MQIEILIRVSSIVGVRKMNGYRCQIEYGAAALGDLDGLPARERTQILRKIERLQHGLHGNIKRLHGAETADRLRYAWAIIGSCSIWSVMLL
jgi:hypothetical protein